MNPWDRYLADWGHELGDPVAYNMWWEDTFGEINIRALARLAALLPLMD